MMTRSRAPRGPDGEAAKPKDPRGTFRRIVEIFRPYRGQLALLAATIVITAGLGVVNPLLIKAVFDKALFGPNKICSGVPCPNLPLLYRLVALGLAIPVVTSLIGVGQTFLSNSLGLRLMRDPLLHAAITRPHEAGPAHARRRRTARPRSRPGRRT